jgi:hypothetical protein
MKGTWQTTDGGGGLAVAAVVGAAILAAAIAGPVAAAVAELARIVVITIAVLGGLALTGGAALVVLRLRQGRASRTTRVSFPRAVPLARAEPLSAPRREAIGPSRPELHLHFHGVTAEDVAEIIARQARRQ